MKVWKIPGAECLLFLNFFFFFSWLTSTTFWFRSPLGERWTGLLSRLWLSMFNWQQHFLIFVLGNLIFDQQIFRISRYRWRHKSTFDFVGMWWFHEFLEYFKKLYANILCRQSYSSFEKFRNYLGIVLINKITQKNEFRCYKRLCYVIFFFFFALTGQLQGYDQNCYVILQIFRKNAKIFHSSVKRKHTLGLCNAKEIPIVEKGIFLHIDLRHLYVWNSNVWRQTNCTIIQNATKT